MKIGRSYTRKAQMENIGGKKYESEEFGAWYEDEAEVDEIDEISDKLFAMAKMDVSQAIEARTQELKSEKWKRPPEELLTDTNKLEAL